MLASIVHLSVERFRGSEYIRHVFVLMLGTGAAQALPVLLSPILTRIYGPTEFGVLGLFVGLAAIAAMVSTARYEIAILLPKEDHEAFHLVVLCAIASAVFCLVATLFCFFFNEPLARLLNCPTLETWLPLVPLFAMTIGWCQSLGCWFNRRKQYKLLAKNRVIRSVVLVVFTIAVGAMGYVSAGLILGALAGQVVALIDLLFRFHRESRRLGYRVDWGAVFSLGKRYRRFALFSTPGDGINAVTVQLPVTLLSAAFSRLLAGYYSFTQRVLLGPVSIIARSIGDVFRQQASERMNSHGECRAIWVKTCKFLLLVSVPTYSLFAFFAPEMFVLVFGEQWQEAGRYAQVLTPYFMLSFTASILGRMTQIAEKQAQDLAWQVALILLVLGSLLVGAWQSKPLLGLSLFSASYSLMYLIYLWMSYRYACEGKLVNQGQV